jgi:hypothetical protein
MKQNNNGGRKQLEEQRKKDEEERNNIIDPMDMDILGSSTDIPLIGGHFPLDELGFGAFTPSKARR